MNLPESPLPDDDDMARIRSMLSGTDNLLDIFAGFFHYSPTGYAMATPEGQVVLTNKAFRDIFGSAPPPEYRMLNDDLARKQGFLHQLARVFEGETVHIPTFWYDPRELEHVNVKEGRRLAVSMTGYPVMDGEGKLEYAIFTYKDDTFEALAKEALIQQCSKLQQAIDEQRSSEYLIGMMLEDGGPELRDRIRARVQPLDSRLDEIFRPDEKGAPPQEADEAPKKPQKAQDARRIRFENWVLDREKMQVFDENGDSRDLTFKEYKLLEAFVLMPNKVLNREQLLDFARSDDDTDVYARAIDIQIARIRRKLGDDARTPQIIKTIRGAGYILPIGTKIID